LVWMGCYGIGLQRLMATIVEAHHDDKGIIWPKSMAPFDCYLINIQKDARNIYEKISENFSVLWDDREDMSVGQKFSDADLLGIPVRLVVSTKTKDKIEWKERNNNKTELLTIGEIIARLKL